MSDKFKLAIYIGRFQPFHNGHKQVLEEAFTIADRVLVILGSHKSARTTKNPFTARERMDMIKKGTNFKNLDFAWVRDYYYSDHLWISNIQSIVNFYTSQHDIDDSEITLITNYKDSSSYYLDLFPQWSKTACWGETKLNATDIRAAIFNPNMGTNDWKKYLPEGTFDWLEHHFVSSETHKQLCKEYKYYEDYYRLWENAPFPVTFVTVDSVVIKSGHVLMVKRKFEPGKGLLALPGGFIKQNEFIEDAAIRELKEETRITIDKPILKNLIKDTKVFDHPDRSLRGRAITHAFFIDLGKGELPKVKGSDDAQHAMWVPLMDLMDNAEEIFEDHLSIIQYFIARK